MDFRHVLVGAIPNPCGEPLTTTSHLLANRSKRQKRKAAGSSGQPRKELWTKGAASNWQLYLAKLAIRGSIA